jgi:hypothetical protein
MTAYLEQFGSTVLPPALPKSDAGTGGSTLQLTPLPWGGQFDGLGSGVAPMPGDKLAYKSRLIGTSTSSLDGLYKAYRLLRGTRAKLYRRNGDTTQHWCWARLIEVKATWDYEHIVHIDLNFEFQMLSPCWYSVTTHDYSSGVAVAEPDDLTTILAESGETTTLHITQTGDIDQPAAIFAVTATGYASMVTINNTTTGYSFTYSATINPGDTLVIDTGAMSVQNNGVDDYAHFTPPANHEEWMHIAPGANTLLITIVGGGSFTISYYAAFA